jgi:hypothetical protein
VAKKEFFSFVFLSLVDFMYKFGNIIFVDIFFSFFSTKKKKIFLLIAYHLFYCLLNVTLI